MGHLGVDEGGEAIVRRQARDIVAVDEAVLRVGKEIKQTK
jgi:hypothetical protein